MRLKCVFRRPRTTVIDAAKYKHPYLLRGLEITRPHQVWAIDITYIPMRSGYMYTCANIDLYSRYLVGWSISNIMEAEWVAIVLGFLNAVVRPLLILLTLPVTIITLGIFIQVINAGMVMLTAQLLDGFHVRNFWWALAFSVVLWAVQGFLLAIDGGEEHDPA